MSNIDGHVNCFCSNHNGAAACVSTCRCIWLNGGKHRTILSDCHNTGNVCTHPFGKKCRIDNLQYLQYCYMQHHLRHLRFNILLISDKQVNEKFKKKSYILYSFILTLILNNRALAGKLKPNMYITKTPLD